MIAAARRRQHRPAAVAGMRHRVRRHAVVALYVLLAPMGKKQRVDKQARLDEVYRYRVLGAYSGLGVEIVPESHAESALTTKALAVVDKAVRARGQHNRIVFELERAGMRMRPEEWAALQLAITVGVAALRRRSCSDRSACSSGCSVGSAAATSSVAARPSGSRRSSRSCPMRCSCSPAHCGPASR